MQRKFRLEVVENQLKDNEPPETKGAYEALQNAGYSMSEAKETVIKSYAASFCYYKGQNSITDPSFNALNFCTKCIFLRKNKGLD